MRHTPRQILWNITLIHSSQVNLNCKTLSCTSRSSWWSKYCCRSSRSCRLYPPPKPHQPNLNQTMQKILLSKSFSDQDLSPKIFLSKAGMIFIIGMDVTSCFPLNTFTDNPVIILINGLSHISGWKYPPPPPISWSSIPQ